MKIINRRKRLRRHVSPYLWNVPAVCTR